MSHGLPWYMSPTLVGGYGRLGLVEEVLVVEDVRRIDGERQADLGAALTDLEEVGELRIDARLRVAGRRDERREVQQLVAEEVEALDADRADDVRGVAGRDLGLEDARRDRVVDDLERDVDVLLRVVVRLDPVLLRGLRCWGWVPAPRPMNQRTTLPPLGPGPAATGSGVTMTSLGRRDAARRRQPRLADGAADAAVGAAGRCAGAAARGDDDGDGAAVARSGSRC